MKPIAHPFEQERLRELRSYGILDTPNERDFDEIVEAAAIVCNVPIALISFVEEDRQWFKARVGLDIAGTSREVSICGHAILQGEFLEIPDTLQDARTLDNPLCLSEDGFRFYAGVVLKGAGGLPLGTLCVLDRVPRVLDASQRRVLQILANQVMRELSLRASLQREKALRLEIDHRVKNSLASIAAIISLKERRTQSDDVRAALQEVRMRIRSLSALHAELHDKGGTAVDLATLFQRATTDLQHTLPADIELAHDVDSALVLPAFANAMLVIANEFVANSVKHGLADMPGSIGLEIRVDDDNWRMSCRDTGTADTVAAERAANNTGLGTQVIRSVARSISATANWKSLDPGMELTVTGSFTAA